MPHFNRGRRAGRCWAAGVTKFCRRSAKVPRWGSILTMSKPVEGEGVVALPCLEKLAMYFLRPFNVIHLGRSNYAYFREDV
jgi:hypothetical protein